MTTWRYRPQLDGLRAFAILPVMALHLRPDLVPGGYLGVQLFFVLSGFLITGLLAAEVERSRKIAYRDFYARRMLRLYPALVVTVVAVLVLDAVMSANHRPSDTTVVTAAGALLYVTDLFTAVGIQASPWLGHTWSLGVEEQFYLVWPFLLLFLLRRQDRERVGRICAQAAIGGLLVIAASRLALGFEPTYATPIGSLPALLAGAAIALLGVRASRALTVAAALSAIYLAAYTLVGPHESELLTYLGPMQLAVTACAVLVAYFVANPGPALMSHPVLVWIGRRSYGLYLYHQLVAISLAESSLPHEPIPLDTLLTLPVTFVVAALSYRFIEEPFLRRKKRFAHVPGQAETEEKIADAKPATS